MGNDEYSRSESRRQEERRFADRQEMNRIQARIWEKKRISDWRESNQVYICSVHGGPGAPSQGGKCGSCVAAEKRAHDKQGREPIIGTFSSSHHGKGKPGGGGGREPFGEEYLVTDYGRANIPQRVGDGLAGHEIIQHAYLKALGLEKSRGSYNAAILLTEEQHRKVDAYQRERGLYDSEKLAKMSLEDIVHENAECLRLAGLRQSAIDRVTEYAFEQFPALQARGVKIWSD